MSAFPRDNYIATQIVRPAKEDEPRLTIVTRDGIHITGLTSIDAAPAIVHELSPLHYARDPNLTDAWKITAISTVKGFFCTIKQGKIFDPVGQLGPTPVGCDFGNVAVDRAPNSRLYQLTLTNTKTDKPCQIAYFDLAQDLIKGVINLEDELTFKTPKSEVPKLNLFAQAAMETTGWALWKHHSMRPSIALDPIPCFTKTDIAVK